jgi:hypothetical protein
MGELYLKLKRASSSLIKPMHSIHELTKNTTCRNSKTVLTGHFERGTTSNKTPLLDRAFS